MRIFVFGSNLAGRHGAGAAKWALLNKGAVYGCGIGLQGQSYAIPTKDEKVKTLPLDRIYTYVQEFKQFAYQHRELTFEVTKIGCGLAGYIPAQIAPFFVDMPFNVILPQEFEIELEKLNQQ
jgi:hypothetical protein